MRRGWSYLDVGCGNGAATLPVASVFGLRAVGVDVDPQQVTLCRQAAGGRTDVTFLTADATRLPFHDGQFDIVATNKMTHHIPEWPAALADMRRVVKPRGYFVYADLTVPPWLAGVSSRHSCDAGVFTRADLDHLFESWRCVHRPVGWLHYEATLQKP